ncbi:DUF1559 family PulG-like putative transporter [Gimesia panareensis]|nr:DUF1559 domain-containing protein [Gimesia panareensis]
MSRAEFGVVIGVMLLLIALVLPALQHSREEARQSMSKNNLKQIGLALYNYEDFHMALPYGGTIREDGVAMHGWLMGIMPFLNQNNFSNRLDYDQSWSSSVNEPVYIASIYCYQVPGVTADYTTTGLGLTHYLGNPNLLHRNRRVTFDQLERGTSYQWIAGEVAGNFQPWSYPFNWRPLGTKLCDGPHSFGHPAWDGGHLLRADGSVTFFSDQTAPEILKAFAEAPPVATREQTAVPDRTFDYGDFHWERVDLQSDLIAENIYVALVLRHYWETSLLINVYTAANRSPEERRNSKSQGDRLHFLLKIDASTDIAAALKATTLKDESSPQQFQANVKLLQEIQKEMTSSDSRQ